MAMRRIFNLSGLSLMMLIFMSTMAAGQDDVLKYVITNGSASGTFTVVDGDDFDIIVDAANIQMAIDAIKTGANGEDCSIQFGEDEDVLDIGDESITFYNDGGSAANWGKITLSGKITSESDSSTVLLTGTVALTVESYADIKNTGDNIDETRAFSISGSSITLIIMDGTVRTDAGFAIHNMSGIVNVNDGIVESSNNTIHNGGIGVLTINGGSVSSSAGHAVYNESSKPLTVSGGTVSSDGSDAAIYSESTADVIISGEDTRIISNGSGHTINSAGDGSIKISDGAEVSNTSNGSALFIGVGTVESIEIRGGVKIFSKEGMAIRNNTSRPVIIENSTVSTGGTHAPFAIHNDHTANIIIAGSKVEGRNAIYNKSTGDITIAETEVSAVNGYAIQNEGTGSVIISEGSVISSANATDAQGTIYNNTGEIIIEDSEVINTASGGNAVRNNSAGQITVKGESVVSALGNGYAVYNNSSGTVTIEDGEIKGEGGVTEMSGGALLNSTNGTLIINGGNIESAGGRAVENLSSNPMEISGGKISATGTNGIAVYNNSNGKIVISEDVQIISANGDLEAGTVSNMAGGTIEVIGGTILNTTANRNAIFNDAEYSGSIVLGGIPQITGRIAVFNADINDGILSVFTSDAGEKEFAPQSERYSLNFLPALSEGDIAVIDGAAFADNFQLTVNGNFVLAADGQNKNLIAEEGWRITFNLNGGAGTVPSFLPVRKGGTPSLSQEPSTNSFTREGFVHDGKWYTRSGTTYTEFKFGETIVAANITLYLKWESTKGILSRDQRKPLEYATPGEIFSELVVTASEFNVGPNPVTKQAGTINFFRQGGGIEKTTLSIYDYSGNLVKKINISDNALESKASRIVGSWDLTDLKRRPVPQGTYLVKGTITARDGSKEKVSLIIGVR